MTIRGALRLRLRFSLRLLLGRRLCKVQLAPVEQPPVIVFAAVFRVIGDSRRLIENTGGIFWRIVEPAAACGLRPQPELEIFRGRYRRIERQHDPKALLCLWVIFSRPIARMGCVGGKGVAEGFPYRAITLEFGAVV